jgi:hypothetical protein
MTIGADYQEIPLIGKENHRIQGYKPLFRLRWSLSSASRISGTRNTTGLLLPSLP